MSSFHSIDYQVSKCYSLPSQFHFVFSISYDFSSFGLFLQKNGHFHINRNLSKNCLYINMNLSGICNNFTSESDNFTERSQNAGRI